MSRPIQTTPAITSTSTTTTAATTDQVKPLPPGEGGAGRPPADEIVNEIFYDKKCGKQDTRSTFFDACINPNENELKGIKCAGWQGNNLKCDMDMTYIFKDTRRTLYSANDIDDDYDGYAYVQLADNSTTSSSSSTIAGGDSSSVGVPISTTSMRPPPADGGRVPWGFKYEYRCGLGPTKRTVWRDTVEVKREQMLEIMEVCRQELYGPPESLPLWLILLIIFLVILAVSITAALFWHYWLRRKIYGRAPGEPSSAIGSRFTSAPFSRSSVPPSSSSSSRFGSGAGPKMSRAPPPGSGSIRSLSGHKNSSQQQQQQQGPFKLSSSRADSVRAKEPSIRSGLSQSSSGRARRQLSNRL